MAYQKHVSHRAFSQVLAMRHVLLIFFSIVDPYIFQFDDGFTRYKVTWEL